MNINTLCSIIIPAYNCGHFLEESVQSALSQSYKDLEIIIIDDCSTDATWSEMQRLQHSNSNLSIYQNPSNLGVAYTRNRAFQLAKGKYIALLDSDDLWKPLKLFQQIHQLESTNADICCSSYEMIDENGNPLHQVYSVPHDLSFRQMLKQNFIGCSTTVFRREVIERIQMRSEFSHEDYVFWLEAMQVGFKITAIDEVLVQYRIQRASRSANKLKAAHNRWKIYRDFLKCNPVKSAYYFFWYVVHSIRKRL